MDLLSGSCLGGGCRVYFFNCAGCDPCLGTLGELYPGDEVVEYGEVILGVAVLYADEEVDVYPPIPAWCDALFEYGCGIPREFP